MVTAFHYVIGYVITCPNDLFLYGLHDFVAVVKVTDAIGVIRGIVNHFAADYVSQRGSKCR